MIALLFSPLGKIVVGILVPALLLTAVYLVGRSDGRAGVVEQLKDDRITILKDGKAIDEKVLRSSDDDLCALLGGCELPDDARRD